MPDFVVRIRAGESQTISHIGNANSAWLKTSYMAANLTKFFQLLLMSYEP